MDDKSVSCQFVTDTIPDGSYFLVHFAIFVLERLYQQTRDSVIKRRIRKANTRPAELDSFESPVDERTGASKSSVKAIKRKFNPRDSPGSSSEPLSHLGAFPEGRGRVTQSIREWRLPINPLQEPRADPSLAEPFELPTDPSVGVVVELPVTPTPTSTLSIVQSLDFVVRQSSRSGLVASEEPDDPLSRNAAVS
jgi:hypothetical protein